MNFGSLCSKARKALNLESTSNNMIAMNKQIKPTIIHLALLTILLLLAGCTSIGQPAEIDPQTGKIKTRSIYGKVHAEVLKSEQVDLTYYKDLVLVLGGNFFREQTQKLGYFGDVVDREAMEKLLIQEGKSDIVSDVTNLLSWKKIADTYKPFLVIEPEIKHEDRTSYFMIKVILADTAEEVFISRVKMDYMWKGVNDDTVFYPAYNSFIDWLNENR